MNVQKLQDKANEIRISIVDMLEDAGSGHTAGPLGMADIFTALYFEILKHDPDNPGWSDRDRLVLSNGHICPVYYATLAHAGYLPISELRTLRKFGSRLQGHPHREFLPCVETSSGPLGSGLSQSVGMCLANRIDDGVDGLHRAQVSKWFYCITGDGELNEGNNWEAIMLAAKERLGNLIVIVDRNNIQIDGNTEDIMPLENLSAKWAAFNWHVQEIDGHNIKEVVDAVNQSKAITNQPSVIIAHTIPGKGVAEIERDYHWHGKPPNKTQEQTWIAQLRSLINFHPE
jgi:transketolase